MSTEDRRITNVILLANQLMDTDFQTGPFDTSRFEVYSIQGTYNTLGTTAGTLKLQVSDDGVTWSDYPSSSHSVTATSTDEFWEVNAKAHQYVRVNWHQTSGSGTVITLKLHAEG
jgi:hypothetical protein